MQATSCDLFLSFPTKTTTQGPPSLALLLTQLISKCHSKFVKGPNLTKDGSLFSRMLVVVPAKANNTCGSMEQRPFPPTPPHTTSFLAPPIFHSQSTLHILIHPSIHAHTVRNLLQAEAFFPSKFNNKNFSRMLTRFTQYKLLISPSAYSIRLMSGKALLRYFQPKRKQNRLGNDFKKKFFCRY